MPSTADKPFGKLTAAEFRGLIQDYADQRDIPWPPLDETDEKGKKRREATWQDVRELLDLDLPAYLEVMRDGPWIDGKHIIANNLAFNEQQALLELVREQLGDDKIELEDGVPPRVYWPALVMIVKKRSDSGYTFEKAGALSYEDLVKPDGDGS